MCGSDSISPRTPSQLYLDGVKHCLPHLEGLVISNINSWSAGCTVWTTPTEGEGRFGACRMDDRRLEVVGIYSSLHVGRIQVGVDEPLKIGQAQEIKVNSGKCMHKFLMCIIYQERTCMQCLFFLKPPGGLRTLLRIWIGEGKLFVICFLASGGCTRQCAHTS